MKGYLLIIPVSIFVVLSLLYLLSQYFPILG